MSEAERWARIEALFADLADVPAAEREVALAAIDDPRIVGELRRLLDAHDEVSGGASEFLRELDPGRAHALVREEEASTPATHIGRYPIVRPLGRGGMGVVYLARDLRLDRQVAIKLLPPYLTGDADAVRRLAAEARTASALDHPNIATVYEIAETDAGQAFIVMAYYDGETLRERLVHGALYPDEALEIGIQLADGLSAAHRAGIIHRDIKPENLILTRDGVLKILDFGIAKAASTDLATGSLMRGTAAYMSPEQSRGDPVDHRSDIWSAGVVLHELLTGTRPFSGEGDALIHAIRNEPAAPLAPTRTGVPPELVTLVSRCLEKHPAARPGTAAELSTSLRVIRDGRSAALPRRGRPTAWIAGTALAASAAILTLLLSRGGAREPTPATAKSAAPAIAVLPFDVRGPDLEIWHEGMVDLLSANLDNAAGMRAIDSRTILARWMRRATGGENPDLRQALGIARETGARYAVLGSVVASGPGIRITAGLHTLDGDSLLAAPQVEGSADSMFALIDRLSIALLTAAWQGRERPTLQADVGHLTTRSLPALKSYLEGERLFRSSNLSDAIRAYEEATAADSTFALAHYHLGVALAWLGNMAVDYTSRAREAFEAALRHSTRLPARERLLLEAGLGFYLGSQTNLQASRARLLRATQLYPDDPEAWYNLGEVAFHAGELLLTPREEGLNAFRTAVKLDPRFALAYEHLIHYEIAEGRDSVHAAELMRQYRTLAPHSDFSEEHRLNLALTFGDWNTRRQALADVTQAPWSTLAGVLQASRDHPELWTGIRAAIGAKPRSNDLTARFVLSRLCQYNLGEGRIAATMQCSSDSLLFAGYAQANWYFMHLVDATLPIRALDSVLVFPPVDTSFGGSWVLQTFVAGAYGADRERWRDHYSARRNLVDAAQHLLSVGDSAGARFASAAEIALAGHGLIRRGDTKAGLPLMVRGQRGSTWLGSRSRLAVNEIIRWRLAQTLLETGQPRQASLYLEALRPDPWAIRLLAQTYERLGERSKARDAYDFVARAWAEADRKVRPLAQEAAAAAARLARDS